MKEHEYFRRATKADYDDIISLVPAGDVEGESLPDYFHMFMDNPLFEATVCIVNDTIVGFGAVIFIDGGTTAGYMYARVHKKFRNRKILRKLQTELIKFHPMPKFGVSSVFSNLQEVYRHINRGVYRLLHTRKCLFYIGQKNRLNFSKVENTKTTKIVRESDLKRIMSDKSSYQHLFENDRLFVFNLSYGLVESNVPIILKDKTCSVVSFMEDKTQTLLTFGSHFRQPNGKMYCNIDIHGTVGSTLATHIILHIKAFIEMVQDDFIIEVRNNDSDSVDQVMTGIGLTKSEGTTGRTGVLFIAHDISSQSKL